MSAVFEETPHVSKLGGRSDVPSTPRRARTKEMRPFFLSPRARDQTGHARCVARARPCAGKASTHLYPEAKTAASQTSRPFCPQNTRRRNSTTHASNHHLPPKTRTARLGVTTGPERASARAVGHYLHTKIPMNATTERTCTTTGWTTSTKIGNRGGSRPAPRPGRRPITQDDPSYQL